MGRVVKLIDEANDIVEEEGGSQEEEMQYRATPAMRGRMKKLVELNRLLDKASKIAEQLGI